VRDRARTYLMSKQCEKTGGQKYQNKTLASVNWSFKRGWEKVGLSDGWRGWKGSSL